MAEEIDNIAEVIKAVMTTPPKPNGATAAAEVEDTPRVPEGGDAPEGDEPIDSPPVEEPEEDEDNIDVDEIALDLLVDGQTKQVKIKDLKKSYSGEGAIEKRLQEATEIRQRVEAHGNELWQAFEQQKAKLQQLDQILARNQPQNIDWEALRTKDPGRYLLERERFREVEDRRRLVLQEHQKVERQQAYLADQARQEYINKEGVALLESFPEIADEEKANTFTTNMANTAKHFGFTLNEFSTVTDHRVMKVLDAAYKWIAHEAQQKKSVVKEVVPRTLLKAGKTAGKTTSVGRKIMEANRKKAMETGKPDDVAKTLLMGPRRRV